MGEKMKKVGWMYKRMDAIRERDYLTRTTGIKHYFRKATRTHPLGYKETIYYLYRGN